MHEFSLSCDSLAHRACLVCVAVCFSTFLEVLNFSDEAWKLLVELSGVVQEFKYELNIDLLSYYFNLFTRYVQIHFLVHLIDTPQLFLASFARAFHHTSGNTEPNFLRIAKYLAAFKPTQNTSPLKKLQDDAQAISLCVGNSLMTFLPLLTKYSTVAGYQAQGKLFNILQEEPKNLSWGCNEKLQLEIIHLNNFRNWVLWGFLVCPAELGRPGALDLLSLALRETFNIVIYRDKTLSIHKEFDELMDYKSANGSFKLNKHKKVFKDAYSDDDGTRKFHGDLRTYLRTELEQFIQFFAECPSCLPAKIQMVFALLSLARNEVLWYFRHLHIQPFKSSKHKGLPPDAQVVEMIHHVIKLSGMVEGAKKDIQAFYVEFMTKIDAPKAKQICEQFMQASHNPAIAALIHALIDNLPQRSAGDNLEAIRLNWYRISAAVTHQQSGIPIHSTGPFSAIMNQIVHHSRNIDCIETQLKAQASFSGLFWYKQELYDVLKDTLKSVDGRVVHCVSIVHLLNSALHNVHRLCPDEQPAIGKEIVSAADEFIRLIVNSLERCLQGVINETTALRSRTNHNAVLQRIAHINAMATGQEKQPLPVPGEESQYDQRRQLVNLAIYHKTISDICTAISQNECIVIYNIEFVLREYLHEAISNMARSTILNLCVQGPAIQKPTIILNRLKDCIYALGSVERALNINVSDIMRDVLLSELSPSAEEITALQAADADPNRPAPIILHIAAFYATMFGQDLALQQGIVYSPLRRCFLSRAGASSAASGAFQFERYTDVSELRALCTLIGPGGVAVIDRQLLKLVQRNAKVVKDVLTANQTVLLNLTGRFTEQSVWLDNIGIIQHMDQLCAATTNIGCILHFRLMLRAALHEVTSKASPFIQHAVQIAYRAAHDNGVICDPRLSGLDNAASDVGLDVGESDHPLRLALSPLKTTVADMNIFQFLPELFGLMYLSQRWRTAAFSIEIEGHTNNNHCMALAIRALLVQFNRIVVKEGVAALDIEKKISQDIDRFIRSSAFTILHLKALNSKEHNAPANQYPIQMIMIFLEQAIMAAAGRVEMSLLEQCFPFTMLRTNFIQVYEKQTNIHRSERVQKQRADRRAHRHPHFSLSPFVRVVLCQFCSRRRRIWRVNLLLLPRPRSPAPLPPRAPLLFPLRRCTSVPHRPLVCSLSAPSAAAFAHRFVSPVLSPSCADNKKQCLLHSTPETNSNSN